jgi:glucan 1,3-beta-glucosidase
LSITLSINTSSQTPKTYLWVKSKQRLRKYLVTPEPFKQGLDIKQVISYYQPNPSAPSPFPVISSLNDPDFAASCAGQSGVCADAWGLRVINSQNILVYGAGLYSFFNDYSTSCSNQGGGENCQNNIFSIEGSSFSNVNMYNLNTVGVTNMITMNGITYATYGSNLDGFVDTIAMWRT